MLTGMALACITFAGMLILFFELPEWAQNWLKRHPLFTDLSASFIAWLGLSSVSKSIVAAFGAAITGLLVGVVLALSKENLTKEKLNNGKAIKRAERK